MAVLKLNNSYVAVTQIIFAPTYINNPVTRLIQHTKSSSHWFIFLTFRVICLSNLSFIKTTFIINHSNYSFWLFILVCLPDKTASIAHEFASQEPILKFVGRRFKKSLFNKIIPSEASLSLICFNDPIIKAIIFGLIPSFIN